MDELRSETAQRATVAAFGEISHGRSLADRFKTDPDYGRTIGVKEALEWGVELGGEFDKSDFTYAKAAFGRYQAKPPSNKIDACSVAMLKLAKRPI